MGLKRPPQHAVDAEPIYIHPDDDAWDMDRVDRERKALATDHKKAKREGDPPLHPWDRYQG